MDISTVRLSLRVVIDFLDGAEQMRQASGMPPAPKTLARNLRQWHDLVRRMERLDRAS